MPYIAIWLLFGQILTAALMAVAIVALFRMGRVLQEGLGQINRRTHEPFVTVSLEASAAGRDHVDLVVENCGFAPAFGVQVTMTPELPAEEGWEDRPEGWHDASLLRPGQAMVAYACRAERLTEHEVLVEVSWKSLPAAENCASLKYRLDMRRYPYQAGLALPAARDEVASELRLLRRDWRQLARGERAMRVELGEDALAALRPSVPQDPKDDGEAPGKADGGKDGHRRGQARDAGPVSTVPVGAPRPAAPSETPSIAREPRQDGQGQGSRERSAPGSP